MDIADRHGEDQLPGEPAEPAEQAGKQPHSTRANDVVAVIDRREQGIKMLGGPGCPCACREDEGRDGPLEPAPQRLAAAMFVAGHDHCLDRAAALGDQCFERTSHRRGRIVDALGKNHDPDAGGRKRIAPEVGLEGVGELVSGRRHSASRRFAQAGCGASQRSTAAQ